MAPPVAVPLSRAEGVEAQAPRVTTGVGELDRVLGGGLVAGSAVLIGGDPGIGNCDGLSANDSGIPGILRTTEHFYTTNASGQACTSTNPCRFSATLTVTDREMVLDMTGSSACAKFGINVPLNYATAYSVFALRCIIGPDIPNNAGSLAPFQVSAPADCILNAQAPAPVAMRHTLGQMTPDLVYGCLSQAVPECVPAEGASCMYDLPLRHVPEAALNGSEQFALELVFNGGTGARPGLDGLSATAFPSGVWGSQIESTEAVAPVLFLRRQLRQDSGGPGRTRGGLGQHIELRSSNGEDFMVFLSVERVLNPAKGRHGGLAGAAGRIRIGHAGEDLPSKGEVRVPAGETLVFETPGGGGFGPPAQRAADKVLRDLEEELISNEAARDIYGVK